VDPASLEGPAARRPFFWRRHGAFLVLLALAAPATIAFSWQGVIASLGDDSVSYLTLARYFSPFSSDPLVAPWAKYHSHFPPLFPLMLAFTGGAQSFLAAHLMVGAWALAALCLVYRYAALRLESAFAGFALAAIFLLTPSAWISIRSILSEPMYLALSLAALLYHDRRLDENAGRRAWIVFALLLAAAYLTRVAGLALLAAYVVHLTVRTIARRKLSTPSPWAFLPMALPVLLSGLWLALRPHQQMDNYQMTVHDIARAWLTSPGATAAISWESLFSGWMASFTGDSGVGSSMRIAFGAVGFMGVAGALLGARRNRLDSWYVLASLAMLFLWVFPEDNERRLLYPLIALLLVHAAEALAGACAYVNARRRVRRLLLLVAGVFVAAMTLPASILVLEKSLDRAPLIQGYAYSAASMTQYYTSVNLERGHRDAAQNAAVLAGLESLDRVTPPGSRVMWMRPEYVAILGHRAGVPWYFGWDQARLAREIRETGTDYVVVARLFKSDLAVVVDDAFAAFTLIRPPYLRARLIIPNPDNGTQEFILLEVDRAALDLYISKGA
jgi:hypothetical protein